MRIIVLGASGQIGFPLLMKIAELFPAASVVGTSREAWEGEGELPSGVEWQVFDPFEGDWSQLGQADVVINSIGAIRGTRKFPFERIHLGLTQRLLAHREMLGSPRLIQISALGADPQQEVEFLRTKGEADQLLLQAPEACVIRPSIVCTPDTMLVRKMKKVAEISRLTLGKTFVPRGFTATSIQPILIADLVELIVRVVQREEVGGIVQAVGPEPITFGNILEWMREETGQKLKIVEVPREIMDSFVRYFVSVWMPGTLNYDQFRLLFQDNVGEAGPVENLLGRPPASSEPFWRMSFAGDTDASPQEAPLNYVPEGENA